jgi:glutamine amidotransferase
MCRLLGIVSSEPTEFRLVLREAPRSIAKLSVEHCDGWGLAIHDRATREWTVEKGVLCASDDERFHDLAIGTRGQLLVAHVRKKTVGPTSISNTHPFRRGKWIFAHNGTIEHTEHLRARTSAARLREIEGETDSEVFFAFLLSVLDAAPEAEHDAAIASVTRELRGRDGFGAFNFLLSDGTVTYAHRFGRTLFLLERGPHDTVRIDRTSEVGPIVHTPWSQRRHALFVASERMTDEPWQEISEGALVRVDALPLPRWRLLFA